MSAAWESPVLARARTRPRDPAEDVSAQLRWQRGALSIAHEHDSTGEERAVAG